MYYTAIYFLFFAKYNSTYPALVPYALKLALSPKNMLTIDFLFPFNLITPKTAQSY